jgi:catechol-2,3-dioxygenase
MKIAKIQLLSFNLAKVKDFYGNVLNFKVKSESQDKISFQAGNSELEFIQKTPFEEDWFIKYKPNNSIGKQLTLSQLKNETEVSSEIANQELNNWIGLNYHFAFNIPTNQITEAKNWLERKGIKLLNFDNQDIIPFPNWNAQAMYFLDTTGNIVEFIARQDLPPSSPAQFSAHSILSISEIGLPVPEIKPVFEQINQNFSLPMYSKISNLTSFCAAGSSEGLLIIVPLNRAWFPTQTINGVFPLEIWLAVNASEEINFQLNNLPYQVNLIA